MGDTCVPYFFKAYGGGAVNMFSEFDFYFNDKLTIKCFYNYNLKGQQIFYHILNDDVLDVFTNIKQAINYCENYI